MILHVDKFCLSDSASEFQRELCLHLNLSEILRLYECYNRLLMGRLTHCFLATCNLHCTNCYFTRLLQILKRCSSFFSLKTYFLITLIFGYIVKSSATFVVIISSRISFGCKITFKYVTF